MKRKTLTGLLALLICLGAVIPALAANTFLFTERTVTLFEGETYQTALRREGNYTGDGEITYASAKGSVATIAADGGQVRGEVRFFQAPSSGGQGYHGRMSPHKREITA